MKPDTRMGARVPTTIRIRLKYPDSGTTIERYCSNLSRGGLFVATRNPRPIGSRVEFEFRLGTDDTPVRGEGEVVWVQAYDADAPDAPHGMGLRFTWLEPEGSKLVASQLGRPDGKRRIVGAPAAAERPVAAAVSAKRRTTSAEMLAAAMDDIARDTEPYARLAPTTVSAAMRAVAEQVGDERAAAGGEADERGAEAPVEDEIARMIAEFGLDDGRIEAAIARARGQVAVGDLADVLG